MTFTQLNYIIAIDEHRSFQRAAQHCYVTQPTMSMQVQKLEDFLGVNIFDRTKTPVMPTAIGKIIIEQARIILRERDKMKVIIENAQKQPKGELKIAVIPTLAPFLLPKFIQEFLDEYPEIQLQIFENTTFSIIEKLKKGEFDAGLMATPIEDTSLSDTPLFYEQLFVYLSEDHPLLDFKVIPIDELKRFNLWLLEEGHCLRSQIINFCDLQSSIHSGSHLNYASGSIDTLVRLIDQGQGATIIPELALDHLTDPQRRRVRPFESPEPLRQISLVTFRPYLKEHLLENLQFSLLRHIPDHMKAIKKGEIIHI
jgi:LysR family transcriptional regulator, hydrogen peroxide-inducible genes activator